MPSDSLGMPDKVRRFALSLGAMGEAWLEGLPRRILEIERDWDIAVGQPMRGGTEAFVAFARTREGQDVVLKVGITGLDPSRQELRTLRAAAGRGYARLLRADEGENVMLIEKLGPQLHELGLPEEQMMAIICGVLREAWQARPDGPYVTGTQKAAELGGIIERNWARYEKPCSERTFDLVLACVERRRRAFDPERSVLAHGDAHEWNTLRASATTFKLIDPDGALAEPAFDLAIPMREWGPTIPPGDLMTLGERRCAMLAAASGVDPAPIWEWSLIQLVSNALLLKQIDVHGAAAASLAMADAWAAGRNWPR